MLDLIAAPRTWVDLVVVSLFLPPFATATRNKKRGTQTFRVLDASEFNLRSLDHVWMGAR